MDAPQTLPAQLYLLAYDPERGRLRTGGQFGLLIRAAIVTELLLSGRLVHEGGKLRATGLPSDDPVPAAVLAQIEESRPRSLEHWIRKDRRAAVTAVRDELAAARLIRVESRRPFLVFHRSVVTVRDTRVPKRLAARVSAALNGPLSRVAPHDAALVSLAAVGELATILPRKRRRSYKKRIGELAERGGPVVPAMRKVIQQTKAAAAG
jgi:hypothetical protein